MLDKELLKETEILIKDKELTLLSEGVFIWNQIVSFLKEKFSKIQYKEIYTSSLEEFVKNSELDKVEYYSLVNELDKINFISYGKYLNEIEEARNTTIDILEIYNLLGKDLLAIPFLMGKDVINQDKNILTTNLGNIDIESNYLGKYQDKYLTSSKITTDILFTILDIHKDESGFIMPPKIAPYQVGIVPLKQNEKGVIKECKRLKEDLISKGLRVYLDDSNKVNSKDKKEYLIKSGCPIILELGPRDLERNLVEITLRDNFEKLDLSNDESLAESLYSLLKKIHKRMHLKILVSSVKEEKKVLKLEELHINDSSRINKIMWCGEENCLSSIKENTNFISFNQQKHSSKCLFCDRNAKYVVSNIKKI